MESHSTGALIKNTGWTSEGLCYKDHIAAMHEEWKKTCKYAKPDMSGSRTSSDAASKKNLTVSKKLKTAFATNLCPSKEGINKAISKVNEQEN